MAQFDLTEFDVDLATCQFGTFGGSTKLSGYGTLDCDGPSGWQPTSAKNALEQPQAAPVDKSVADRLLCGPYSAGVSCHGSRILKPR